MIKVAIIGLGIMGRRMLQHMRIHDNFQPNFLWDPDKNACQKALEIFRKTAEHWKDSSWGTPGPQEANK